MGHRQHCRGFAVLVSYIGARTRLPGEGREQLDLMSLSPFFEGFHADESCSQTAL